jgi:hypothetical protein
MAALRLEEANAPHWAFFEKVEPVVNTSAQALRKCPTTSTAEAAATTATNTRRLSGSPSLPEHVARMERSEIRERGSRIPLRFMRATALDCFGGRKPP